MGEVSSVRPVGSRTLKISEYKLPICNEFLGKRKIERSLELDAVATYAVLYEEFFINHSKVK